MSSRCWSGNIGCCERTQTHWRTQSWCSAKHIFPLYRQKRQRWIDFLYLHRHHSVQVPHEEATLQKQSVITFRGANNLVLQLQPPSTTFPDRLALDQLRLCGVEFQSRKSTFENRSFRVTFFDPEDSAMQYTAQCGMCPWIFGVFHNYTAFTLCLI